MDTEDTRIQRKKADVAVNAAVAPAKNVVVAAAKGINTVAAAAGTSTVAAAAKGTSTAAAAVKGIRVIMALRHSNRKGLKEARHGV